MENKKVPNPWGKKGCPEHRDEVLKLAGEIALSGNTPGIEFQVRTPNGKKLSRFIDVADIDADTREPVNFYQVGKATANGNPPTREIEAMDDIEKETGIRPIFKPYNLIIFALLFLTGALIFEML